MSTDNCRNPSVTFSSTKYQLLLDSIITLCTRVAAKQSIVFGPVHRCVCGSAQSVLSCLQSSLLWGLATSWTIFIHWRLSSIFEKPVIRNWCYAVECVFWWPRKSLDFGGIWPWPPILTAIRVFFWKCAVTAKTIQQISIYLLHMFIHHVRFYGPRKTGCIWPWCFTPIATSILLGKKIA